MQMQMRDVFFVDDGRIRRWDRALVNAHGIGERAVEKIIISLRDLGQYARECRFLGRR